MPRKKKEESNELKEEKGLLDLDGMIDNLEKKYGKGTISKGSRIENIGVDFWKLSSPKLTKFLGGGFAKGRLIEVYGLESSGKSTLSDYFVSQVQRGGGKCCYIDMEHSHDLKYSKKLGVDIDNLYFSQPSSGEQALQIADSLIPYVNLIVIDSVPALIPQSEIDGEIGDSNIGVQARLMSQACRKLVSKANQHKCSLIFINQIRQKIGVMFGNPNVTGGGLALRFYTSYRLELRKSDLITENNKIIGQKTVIKAVKNKVGGEIYGAVELDLLFGKGFDTDKEYFDFGIIQGLIKKSGSWYSYGEDRIGQGERNALNYLKENNLFDKLKEELDQFIVKESE